SKAKGIINANLQNISWKLAFELMVRLQNLSSFESETELMVLTQKNMLRVFQERLIKNNSLK
ncbi:hypothetical protein MJH12_12080, partial [bacterium]|nr:hypothetical protein [bacterium]